MNLITYIKVHGWKATYKAIYEYQIDKYLLKVIRVIFKRKPLENIIVIESHNDFDCNGGTFYDYLIKNGYNKKYKIVWLLKYPELKPEKMAENVVCVPLFRPSIKKNYYIWMAKYFTADNIVTGKKREGQMSIYMGHGSMALKRVDAIIPSCVDYVLIGSDVTAPYFSIDYKLPYPNDKFIYLGYPIHDKLYGHKGNELSKITDRKYDKYILWMPTFRRGGGSRLRNDSRKEQKLGVPLFETYEEYKSLNKYLLNYNTLLIIKIHPNQNLENLKIKSLSNIVVITISDAKKMKLGNYELLPEVDALISDYSSIAYDFLHINRPIGFVLDDIDEYIGFTVSDPLQWMPGEKIYSLKDMRRMIKDVIEGRDPYQEERHKIFDMVYKYHDGESCKRLTEFMKL